MGGRLARDQSLFESLVTGHNSRLSSYIRTLLPRRDLADEVLQRTVAVLWEHFGDYDISRAFYPWAARFAYYEVLNFRKERARDRLVFREDVLSEIAQTRVELEGLLERRQDALKLCLEQLPAKDLELLRRKYCSPDTVTLLAGELNTTRKALYRRLDRLRSQLAECITKRLARQAERDA